MLIDVNKVSFDGYYPDKRTIWQDVMYEGKKIAALAQVEHALMAPIEVWCQKLVPESEAPHVPSFYESEDPGFIFAVFPEKDGDLGLGALIDYLNKRG